MCSSHLLSVAYWPAPCWSCCSCQSEEMWLPPGLLSGWGADFWGERTKQRKMGMEIKRAWRCSPWGLPIKPLPCLYSLWVWGNSCHIWPVETSVWPRTPIATLRVTGCLTCASINLWERVCQTWLCQKLRGPWKEEIVLQRHGTTWLMYKSHDLTSTLMKVHCFLFLSLFCLFFAKEMSLLASREHLKA